MENPLRILMVLHMPWDRNLGGPRVQLELSEEFEKMGHHVEKFDLSDAFPRRAAVRWLECCQPSFSTRAIDFVRRNASRFDIMDAHQGNLPISKAALGFRGLLVARSVGLFAFYQQFTRFEQARWPSPVTWKSILRPMLHGATRPPSSRQFRQSLEYADLITVPNDDELRYVQDEMGLGGKCRVLPFGLGDARIQALASVNRTAAERLPERTIAFVGAWGTRKGSKDWGRIVRRVRRDVPDTRFLFLGTGVSAEAVLRDLEVSAGDWVRVVPSFDNGQLPDLLAGATVGAFPSYIEGFGFAVLEKLAAGLPTVAYDVPGPRAMLRGLGLMVPAGDAEALGARLSALLRASVQDYARLADECRAVASRFRWRDIAVQTLAAYQEGLAELTRPIETGFMTNRVHGDRGSNRRLNPEACLESN